MTKLEWIKNDIRGIKIYLNHLESLIEEILKEDSTREPLEGETLVEVSIATGEPNE